MWSRAALSYSNVVTYALFLVRQDAHECTTNDAPHSTAKLLWDKHLLIIAVTIPVKSAQGRVLVACIAYIDSVMMNRKLTT